jgi:hypothetical protein
MNTDATEEWNIARNTRGKCVRRNSVRIFVGGIKRRNAAAHDFWLVTFKVRSICYLGHVTRTASSVQPEVTASGHSSSVTWCCCEQAAYVRSKKDRVLTSQGLTCLNGRWALMFSRTWESSRFWVLIKWAHNSCTKYAITLFLPQKNNASPTSVYMFVI